MRGRNHMVIMLGLLGVIVAGGGGWTAIAAQGAAGEDGVSAEGPVGKDGAPMVVIPEGEFIMGTNASDARSNERPEHPVWLPTYAIDKFEVTMTRYEQFMQATGQMPPPLWDPEAVGEVGDHPAVGLTWKDAAAYCKWAGKRLPTEAEWEKAARGTDGRRYPWGHMQPFVDIANYNRGVWVSYKITLAPVESGVSGMSIRHGLKEGGKSPYGLYHMSGNAAEWVADFYDREYYSRSSKKSPTGPEKGENHVIRGGSWSDTPVGLRTTARVSAPPDYQDLTIGVRCVMDMQGK